jgi:predicted nucleotidyltransferase
MGTRNDDVKKIVRYFINKLGARYSIERAYLFGSHAKGTANAWSDIDVAVLSPDFTDDMIEDRLVLMKLATLIDDRIEPIPYNMESFDINDPVVNEIKTYGIQII